MDVIRQYTYNSPRSTVRNITRNKWYRFRKAIKLGCAFIILQYDEAEYLHRAINSLHYRDKRDSREGLP